VHACALVASLAVVTSADEAPNDNAARLAAAGVLPRIRGGDARARHAPGGGGRAAAARRLRCAALGVRAPGGCERAGGGGGRAGSAGTVPPEARALSWRTTRRRVPAAAARALAQLCREAPRGFAAAGARAGGAGGVRGGDALARADGAGVPGALAALSGLSARARLSPIGRAALAQLLQSATTRPRAANESGSGRDAPQQQLRAPAAARRRRP
jgi:hypothetical protein